VAIKNLISSNSASTTGFWTSVRLGWAYGAGSVFENHEQASRVPVGIVGWARRQLLLPVDLIAAITCPMWFAKNVRHVWDDGRRGRTMYFATVA